MSLWTRRSTLFVAMLVAGCSSRGESPATPVAEASPSPSAGRSSEPRAKPEPEEAEPTEDELRARDPVCQKVSGLKLECRKKYGDIYGDDQMGLLDRFYGLVFVDVWKDGLDCFKAYGVTGLSEFLPPLGTPCHLAPRNACVAVASQAEVDQPWKYVRPGPQSGSPWTEFAKWMDELPSGTHTRFGWDATGGDCEFFIEGLADLDGDTVYSTYVHGARRSDGATTRDFGVLEDPKWRDRVPEGYKESVKLAPMPEGG